MDVHFSADLPSLHRAFANPGPADASDPSAQENGNKSLPEGAATEELRGSDSTTSKIASNSDAALTAEEKRIVDQLRVRDREVRAHEQAHKAAAGGLAKGAATFDYETGPDGRQYAVGGEVQIDTAEVPGDPAATLRKAQTIRRAANAPRNPSAQDRQVATQAAKMAAQARQELNQERTEKTQEAGGANIISRNSASNPTIQEETGPEGQSSRSPTKSPPTTGNFLDIVL